MMGAGSRIRGAVLMETLVAIVIFVGAAAFTLAANTSAIRAVDRTRRQLEAADLARSKLAELEAGLITLADLRGKSHDTVGSSNRDSQPRPADEQPDWSIDVKTSRSEFNTLTLVELTVKEGADEGGVQPEGAVSYTLRQLVQLHESPSGSDAESAASFASPSSASGEAGFLGPATPPARSGGRR